MKLEYQLPQEVEVWRLIPPIRRRLSRVLSKEHGLSYDKIAKAFGITKAAVLQYVNNKRASKIRLNKSVEKEFDKSAIWISQKKKKSPYEIFRILDFMGKEKISFEVYGPVHVDAVCKEIKVYKMYGDRSRPEEKFK